MHPKTAIYVEGCSPDACTAEKVIAEHLSHIACIILEPFEVELSDSLDLVIAVFDELAKVYTEMTMLPICSISDVFSVITMCFRSAT
jgi:hypothetical protein